MINLQFDIGPALHCACTVHLYGTGGCQNVIISRLLAFGNGTNETVCDARNVAHILDGGQRTLFAPPSPTIPYSVCACVCVCECACVCLCVYNTLDTNKKIYFGHETYIIGKSLSRLLPDVYHVSCDVLNAYTRRSGGQQQQKQLARAPVDVYKDSISLLRHAQRRPPSPPVTTYRSTLLPIPSAASRIIISRHVVFFFRLSACKCNNMHFPRVQHRLAIGWTQKRFRFRNRTLQL